MMQLNIKPVYGKSNHVIQLSESEIQILREKSQTMGVCSLAKAFNLNVRTIRKILAANKIQPTRYTRLCDWQVQVIKRESQAMTVAELAKKAETTRATVYKILAAEGIKPVSSVKVWEESDTRFLIENSSKIRPDKIAGILGFSITTVRKKAQSLGLTILSAR
jgi:DNA invertase Pin-like site-specific DNA recombinase